MTLEMLETEIERYVAVKGNRTRRQRAVDAMISLMEALSPRDHSLGMPFGFSHLNDARGARAMKRFFEHASPGDSERVRHWMDEMQAGLASLAKHRGCRRDPTPDSEWVDYEVCPECDRLQMEMKRALPFLFN